MTTFLDVRDRIADQLSRSDLSSQIDREIQLAIARYNRRVSWLHEVRGATLTTVAGQRFYTAIDLTAGAGVQDVAGRSAVSVQDVQKIEYMRASDDEPLCQIGYREFEERYDVTGSVGGPEYFALYAGQIGLWPAPDAVEVLTLSVVVKPVIPTAATDESVWFDQAQELIENAAASAICRKFLSDGERAQAFQVYEAAAWDELVREGNQKMATGRLRSHD